MRNLRTVSAVRAAYGLALLAAPAATARMLGAGPLSPPSAGVARVLGVRHLTQAAVSLAKPTPATAKLGFLTDVAHAASMVYLAAHAPKWRTPAARSAVVATTFAVGDAAALRA